MYLQKSSSYSNPHFTELPNHRMAVALHKPPDKNLSKAIEFGFGFGEV